MANIPTTISIQSLDKKLSTEMLLIAAKHLFMFGVKEIKQRGEQVLIYLTYSPKNETLHQKLHKLPVSFCRLKVENERELSLLEEMVMNYGVQFQQSIEPETSEAGPSTLKGQKRSIKWLGEEDEKIKILENRIIRPADPKPAKRTKLVEVYDKDSGKYDAQKYHVEERDVDDDYDDDIDVVEVPTTW